MLFRSTFHATILTLYPEMFPGPLGVSLAGRALGEGAWACETVQIRDFAEDRHRTVDDTPAGGGAGMVLKVDVLARAIDHARAAHPEAPVLAMTPRGKPLSQVRVRELAAADPVLSSLVEPLLPIIAVMTHEADRLRQQTTHCLPQNLLLHAPGLRRQREQLERRGGEAVAQHGAAVADAGETLQMALIRAHPQLAGKAAIRGELTESSTNEQRGAGLDQCSPEEFAEITQLNADYDARFGFPFILAVKGHTRSSILANMRARIGHDRDAEITEALKQIERIARFRLEALLS